MWLAYRPIYLWHTQQMITVPTDSAMSAVSTEHTNRLAMHKDYSNCRQVHLHSSHSSDPFIHARGGCGRPEGAYYVGGKEANCLHLEPGEEIPPIVRARIFG